MTRCSRGPRNLCLPVRRNLRRVDKASETFAKVIYVKGIWEGSGLLQAGLGNRDPGTSAWPRADSAHICLL